MRDPELEHPRRGNDYLIKPGGRLRNESLRRRPQDVIYWYSAGTAGLADHLAETLQLVELSLPGVPSQLIDLNPQAEPNCHGVALCLAVLSLARGNRRLHHQTR